jgi:dihydroflavonol-4-reductase
VRVLITGGTGFIGSHAVRAVTAAGHDVHLLVRSPARIAPALEPIEVEPPQHTVGDATDPDAVRAALDGCDAAIHCAGIYSFNPRDAGRMTATNRRAAEVVFKEALERGCKCVYCSSMVSLLPVRTPTASPESPVGDSRLPYVRSKADAERLVRDLQADGGPLASVLPGGVTGPHDPYVGESNEYWIRRPLRGMLPFGFAHGASALVDVREVAAVLAACLTQGDGPRTYVTGRYLKWNDAFAILRRLTGRRLPQLPTPAPVARASGLALNPLARVRVPVPFTYESVSMLFQGWAPTDETAVRSDLGVAEVPLETSFADTIRWMVEAGHLRPAQAGALTE